LAFEAFSFYMYILMIFDNGGDRFRRDMRNAGLHAEDVSSLHNHLTKHINADYGYMAAA